jgi:hypothetical protein
VLQTWEAPILETATPWEQDGVARGAGQELIGAVADTFLERLVLLLRDLTTGSSGREDTADERRSAPWQARVDQRRDAVQAPGRSVVRARAKARIQRAAKGLECLRRPAVFPLVPDLVPRDSRALGQRLQQARQA